TRELASEVVQYVLLRVLARQRHVAEYSAQQAAKVWRPLPPRKTSDTKIAVLGAGRIGGWAAQLFCQFGFQTAIWSRRPRQMPGMECLHGPDEFAAAIGGRDYVICTLPLTDETRGILGAAAFAEMRDGAYLINVGRGGHVDELALLAAIQAGRIAGACL